MCDDRHAVMHSYMSHITITYTDNRDEHKRKCIHDHRNDEEHDKYSLTVLAMISINTICKAYIYTYVS